MPAKPIWRDLAIATLREHGPMSKADLAELLGTSGARAAAAIATARHENPGKFFRVTRYEVQSGRAGREIPIYTAAGGADAPRPDFSSRERKRAQQHAYYVRNRASVLARQQVQRRSGKEVNRWMQLMEPKARREVGNSLRMSERNARA